MRRVFPFILCGSVRMTGRKPTCNPGPVLRPQLPGPGSERKTDFRRADCTLTCDSIRMVSGIWKHNHPYMDNYRLPMQVERLSAKNTPRGTGENKAGPYNYRADISEEELIRSIRLYNSNRNLLRKLFNLHECNPDVISNKDLYTVLGASMVIEREKLNRLLSELVKSLEDKTKKPVKKTKLYLSGTFINLPEILDYLDESGGAVVGDDLKNGFRYIEADVAETGVSPLESLAIRQLKKIPLPVTMAKPAQV